PADGDCGAGAAGERTLAFWPVLGSGGPDFVMARQFGTSGQCLHFLADTGDGLSPGGRDLAGAAYTRCVRALGRLLDGILADPVAWGARAADGRACAAIHNAYAMPSECLTPNAKQAAAAVVDLLIVTWRMFAAADGAQVTPSLAIPELAAMWRSYLELHFASD